MTEEELIELQRVSVKFSSICDKYLKTEEDFKRLCNLNCKDGYKLFNERLEKVLKDSMK